MNSPTTILSSAAPSVQDAVRVRHPIPNVYHLHPLVAGPLESWSSVFERVARMGFSHVCLAPPFEPASNGDIFIHATFELLHPALQFSGSADQGIALAVRQAEQVGLKLLLDIAPGSVAADSPLFGSYREWFAPTDDRHVADPRLPPHRIGVASPNFEPTAIADAVSDWWIGLLHRWTAVGVAGVRCLTLDGVPPSFWRRLTHACPETLFLAWTPGVSREALANFAECGFDLTCSSAGWWDSRAEWLVEELAVLPWIGPALAGPEPSFLHRLVSRLPHDADIPLAYRQALGIAAATGAGLFIPMGFEYAARKPFDAARATPADMEAARQEALVDLADDIEAAIRTTSALPPPRAVRTLTGAGAPVTALIRLDAPDIRLAKSASLILINPDLLRPAASPVLHGALPPSAGVALVAGDAATAELRPGEIRIVPCRRTAPITGRALTLARPWAESNRVAVENVQPTVLDGDFPAKTVIGRDLIISADVFGDGHDVLAAAVLWRPADETAWQRIPMRGPENDRWKAAICPDRIGLYQFAVEGWWDQWGTFIHDLHAKVAAGQRVTLELEEGRQLVVQALTHAEGDARVRLQAALTGQPEPEMLLDPKLAAAMHKTDERLFSTISPVYSIRVDRPAAEFAAWYELFPRSATQDARVHGTFRSVIERLPDIRAMGFDVLYFPPINPIGTINRKGRNNSLRAAPGDVGSPYAIGSAEGGHDAVHPALGTLDDFRLLQQKAHDHGLEIALDFAIQCAPDHPWVREHKDWFRWRPDGSMRYAENPPKKYEDIVNPDFYGSASFPAVWTALRDVIRFWVDQGVRIFRVDNPHTKPLPFWQWMIADIQSDYPDVLFLSEAFTRPKLMYRLAKVGFSQSYTYFTWRNTKKEIIEYLTELTAPPVADFFRPNFFVNTPDINPFFLQTSGRAGFLIRAALAATLSGLWGVYSGFELCESAPLPGREEYLDSEKYEIRPRDYHAPGNIIAEISALNRIRRLNPALQTHLGVRFYTAHNDQIILYGKHDVEAGTMILVAVSFDPHNAQEALIEVPLWELGIPDNGAVSVTDLMHGDNFTWYGKNQRIRLDPSGLPFHIWRLSRVGVT